VVVTVHDIESFHSKNSQVSSNLLFNLVDGIILHNRSSIDEFKMKFKLDVNKPMAIIPHGNYMNYTGKYKTQNEAREKLNIPTEIPILLFFGRLKSKRLRHCNQGFIFD